MDHRHTNVAVTHRERSHGQSGVGAGLAAAVAGSKAQVAVMLLEELLNIAQLLVVECLAAGADGQHVGHIIVSRKTLAAARGSSIMETTTAIRAGGRMVSSQVGRNLSEEP